MHQSQVANNNSKRDEVRSNPKEISFEQSARDDNTDRQEEKKVRKDSESVKV